MLKNILNLFFPKVCFGCDGILLTDEIVICTTCRHNIPLTNHCFQFENEMFQRFYGRIPVEFVGAKLFFHKKGIVQRLIYNLKYFGHQEIGTEIGNWFAEDLKNLDQMKSIDAIIPVPLHEKRLKKRGYNQVTTFGMALSKKLNIDYNPNILYRQIHKESQSKKVFTDRTDVNTSVFDVVFDEKNHNKHFLIIDDVFTTGATLELCAKALLKIPGCKISIVCMTMAH
jgi:ComF family protein